MSAGKGVTDLFHACDMYKLIFRRLRRTDSLLSDIPTCPVTFALVSQWEISAATPGVRTTSNNASSETRGSSLSSSASGCPMPPLAPRTLTLNVLTWCPRLREVVALLIEGNMLLKDMRCVQRNTYFYEADVFMTAARKFCTAVSKKHFVPTLHSAPHTQKENNTQEGDSSARVHQSVQTHRVQSECYSRVLYDCCVHMVHVWRYFLLFVRENLSAFSVEVL